MFCSEHPHALSSSSLRSMCSLHARFLLVMPRALSAALASSNLHASQLNRSQCIEMSPVAWSWLASHWHICNHSRRGSQATLCVDPSTDALHRRGRGGDSPVFAPGFGPSRQKS